MNQDDIRPCAVCKKGIAHDNNIAFFRVRIEHMVLDLGAIRRHSGLEMMLGSAAIARAMGPCENIANVVSESSGLVCQECLITTLAGVIWEALASHE